MQRLVIIGSGGSGKSFLARELGARMELPVVHLDPLFWRPGWVETDEAEWRSTQAALVREPRWIIDGNHASTLDVRLPAADTVIFLDVRRSLCMWRVIKRSVQHRRRSRPDRAEGCQERLNWSFLRWVWTFPRQGRPQALAAVARYAPQAELVVLRRRRDIDAFVERCSKEGVSRRAP